MAARIRRRNPIAAVLVFECQPDLPLGRGPGVAGSWCDGSGEGHGRNLDEALGDHGGCAVITAFGANPDRSSVVSSCRGTHCNYPSVTSGEYGLSESRVRNIRNNGDV